MQTKTKETMASQSPMYAELKQDVSSSSSLLSEGNEEGTTYHVEPKWSTRRWIATLLTSLVVTNTINTIVTSKTVLSHHPQKQCPPTLWEPPDGIVPYFSNISLELKAVRRYAPFYDREDSLYRKHENPETEVAWRKLTQLGGWFLLGVRDRKEY